MQKSPPGGRISRILVVDDERDTAESTASLLRIFGYEVQTAFDGRRAIDLSRSAWPECILLDLGLPGIDGFQVAVQVRGGEARYTPIIAISGRGGSESRREAYQCGVDRFFIKPVDVEELIALLAALKPGVAPTPAAESPRAAACCIVVHHRQVEIVNPLGLHLRAADKLARLLQGFQAGVRVRRGEREADGKSVLDLMLLAAESGSRVDLEAQGSDAESALAAVVELVERGFEDSPLPFHPGSSRRA